jgi:hypothetical protein
LFLQTLSFFIIPLSQPFLFLQLLLQTLFLLKGSNLLLLCLGEFFLAGGELIFEFADVGLGHGSFSEGAHLTVSQILF